MFFVGAGVFEEQDGDAAGGDVVAAEGGDEAVELVEPAGALAVGGEVDGAAVDAGFDAPLGVGDEGGLLGDGAGVAAVEGEALADAEGGEVLELLVRLAVRALWRAETPATSGSIRVIAVRGLLQMREMRGRKVCAPAVCEQCKWTRVE